MKTAWPAYRVVRLCAGLLLTSSLFAQQPAAQKPGIVIRTTTRLVEVNVVVHDKKGQPVTDLRKEDFVIEDDGKPQEISIFFLETPQSSSIRRPAMPHGVFSNRHNERAAKAGGVTAIVLDGLNTSWGDQAQVRQHVMKYLQQIQPEDRVALYALGRQIKVLHDYTQDPKILVNALSEYLGRSSPELAASHIGAIQVMQENADAAVDEQAAKEATEAIQGIINTLKEEEYFNKQERILMTLKSFEAIANHLAAVPGRKNLVWVSGSFPLRIGYFEAPDSSRGPSPEISDSPFSARFPAERSRRRVPFPDPVMVKHGRSRTFDQELDRTVRVLSAANIAVYPVDARGLSPNPQVSENLAAMNDLAGGTGGKAYYNTNDIMNSIRDAVEDDETSYTLAYYPAQQKLDSRFHRIRVKTKRSGLVVRHRLGYYDVAETASDAEAAMQNAVWSPLDATGVALEAFVPPPGKAQPDTMSVQVRVASDGITLEPNGDRWSAKLEVLLAQVDGQGNGYQSRSQTVSLELPPGAYDTFLKQGYLYREKVQKAKKASELRIIIRDVPSGKMGSVRIPFSEIPESNP